MYAGDPVHNLAWLRQLDAQPHHLHGVQPGLQGRLQEDHDLQYFATLKMRQCDVNLILMRNDLRKQMFLFDCFQHKLNYGRK